jgi:hypothetical protein
MTKWKTSISVGDARNISKERAMNILIWLGVSYCILVGGILLMLRQAHSSRCAVCGEKIFEEQEGAMMLKGIGYVPVHASCQSKAILTGIAKSIYA